MTLAPASALVVELNGSGCNLREVGGKAAGLERLAAHGFPIPRSYVVTASAYRDAVASAGIDDSLRQLGPNPTVSLQSLGADADEIEHAFRGVQLASDLRAELSSVADRLLVGGSIAVRSSATAEDLPVSSFAGQYRTYTRVQSLEAMIDSVKLCWASLWLPAARDYRSRHGISSEDLAMAVVIQAMVEPEWSGVGFTEDPGTDAHIMRVEMVPGTGEKLVSGSVTPLDYRISRETLRVIPSDPEEAAPPCIESVARMMLQVEYQFDGPQDIEWAATGEDVVLLQARPITVTGPRTLLDDGFDGPRGTVDVFTPHGVVEMLPATLSPLVWTINAPMVEHAYRGVIAALGGDPGDLQRSFIGRFRGRAALNLSALRDVAASLPGGSADDVERQFLGRVVTPEPETPTSRRGMVRATWQGRKALRQLDREVDLVTAAAEGIVGLEQGLTLLPAWRLVGYRHAVRDLGWRCTAAEVATSGAAAAAYRALEMILGRWLEDAEAATWAQRLTRGAIGSHAAGARLDSELTSALDDVAAAHPDVLVAVACEDWSDVPRRLLEMGDPGTELVQAVFTAARRAGSQAAYAGPAWEEAPGIVWSRLQAAARQSSRPAAPPVSETLVELAIQLRRRPSWGLIRVLTGQVVDLRLRWIERQAGEARRSLRRRERAKSALLTLGGEERRIIREMARRLATSGLVDAPSEIELLSDHEVDDMLLGTPAPPEADLGWRRTAGRRAASAPRLPELFCGTPEMEVSSEGEAGSLLSGWAASPGRVRGPARIVEDIAAGATLEPGSVLIAVATDPSWTPVIAEAAAIVLEVGGPLSHAAIVARELGIPAVLKVNGATRAIGEGCLVEVDGFEGTVRVVEGVEVAA